MSPDQPDQWNVGASPVAPGLTQPPPADPGQGGAAMPEPAAPAPPLAVQTAPPSSVFPSVPQQAPAQPVGFAAGGADTPDLRASSNIQGNILAGFRKDHQIFVFLKLPPDTVQARGWLGELTPRIAATKEVAAFNARFSAARLRNGGDDPENLQAKWVNVGLTVSGLQLLGSPQIMTDLHSFDGTGFPAFTAGAASRAAQLGDAAPGSDPSRWLVGGPGQPAVDALLTVAADDPDDLLVEMEKLRALATKYGVVTVFEQRGNTLPGGRAGHEHFGFKDGISQPGVRGFDGPEPNAQNGMTLTAAGEFVLGHPGESGPDPRPCPDWMKDGAFQVWRRLDQDVPGFWGQMTAQLETARATSFPSDDPMKEDMIAAKLMGRWRSGTPLDAAPNADDRSARDPKDDNAFDFSGRAQDGSSLAPGAPPAVDSTGLRCPMDAHIRKMNPRNGAEAQHRIIRRGIPFGLPFDPAGGRGHGVDADRGLLFMAFMANIEGQFEFLQQMWANTGFPGAGAGPDPIIGTPTGGQPTHTIKRNGLPDLQLTLKRFVQTMGAVYAFAPSLATLKALAAGTL